jgi:DNA-binding NarL/FixJ family response regulator
MRRQTILLADDHVVFTDGIVRLLVDRFDVVGCVTDGGRLIQAARRLHPDLIIMDISMPTLSGLEALRQLRAQHADWRVIILTMHGDPKMAAEAFRLGAKGFVLKQCTGEELITAIQAVLQGHTYLAAALTEDVLTLVSAPSGGDVVDLTSRQREVLRLIVNGQRVKEIAAALDLSPRTVESIKYEMMRALDVHSTTELVKYAMQHRLIHF